MRILVTGAAGYIGSVLTPTLLAAGHTVRAVDRFFFGDSLADHERLEIVREDTRLLRLEHFNGVDAVIDLVAISNDPSGEAFLEETYAINWRSRVNTATLAKKAGVKRYILPSSCSIYGFQESYVIADEGSPTNALTTYAKANENAEQDIVRLADDQFCVVILRQATVYGVSPRMRFDLAINGMVYGAWTTGELPLMRDGTQWRPMVHVKDAVRAQMFMLDAAADKVNGSIFNVGSAENVYQIGPLAETVAKAMPKDVKIVWYGDPDHRSYRVAFDKIEALGWKATLTAADGAAEIVEALASGKIDKTPQTITLQWYLELERMFEHVRRLQKYDRMLRF